MNLADAEDVKAATSMLLRALEGTESRRDGLADTPARVARFWLEWRGEAPPTLTTFDAEQADQLVVQVGIPVYSLCEHHLLPFFGTAVVGYLPGSRIVGLSKLARVVRFLGARPQNQERLTRQVAEAVHKAPGLAPLGVGVVLRCRHLCMEMRGVRATGAETVTSHLEGVIRTDAAARAEFLDLAGGAR